MPDEKGPALPQSDVAAAVRDEVAAARIVDLHTHLYEEHFGSLLLRGIDDLLTYHYLISESVRAAEIAPAKFYAMDKAGQAEFVWDELFVKRSPVSEATRGIVTAAAAFGLDARAEGLSGLRGFYEGLTPEKHVDMAFEAAGVSEVVMTNDPFDDEETPYWDESWRRDDRFLAGLRIDHLVAHLETSHVKLSEWGYEVGADFSGKSASEARRFLADWIKRTDARYCAMSFAPEFVWPDESVPGRVLGEAVIPACRDAGIPFALMIGVNRRVNPELKKAGDTLGRGDVSSVGRLCAEFPDVRFLCTMLSRENQHELAVTARKFSNLAVFGCWWYVNTPSIVSEITAERLELLGITFVPQHSDARVLDQLVYKWRHARHSIADVLVAKYEDLSNAGWGLTRADVKRDVETLFSGIPGRWLGLKE